MAVPRLLSAKRGQLQARLNKVPNLPVLHRKLLLASVFVVAAALLWPTPQEFSSQRIPVALDIESFLPNGTSASTFEIVEPIKPNFERVIQNGDTLEGFIEDRQMFKVNVK